MISVMMSVYNEPINYLKKSVFSILNQDYQDIEFIIVLDNPKNNNARIFLKNISKRDSRLIFLENKENMGLIYSLNRAFRASKGEYIARMDADDISKKNRLNKELHYLIKNSLDLVATNTVNFSDKKNKETKYPERNVIIKFFLRYGNCMPHPTWLARRKVYRELNGYRKIFSCEDYDFLLRGAERGFKYGLLKEPLLEYRINSGGITQSNLSYQASLSYLLQTEYKKSKIIDLNYIKEWVDSKEYCDQAEALRILKSGNIVNILTTGIKSKFLRNLIKNNIITRIVEIGRL